MEYINFTEKAGNAILVKMHYFQLIKISTNSTLLFYLKKSILFTGFKISKSQRIKQIILLFTYHTSNG